RGPIHVIRSREKQQQRLSESASFRGSQLEVPMVTPIPCGGIQNLTQVSSACLSQVSVLKDISQCRNRLSLSQTFQCSFIRGNPSLVLLGRQPHAVVQQLSYL